MTSEYIFSGSLPENASTYVTRQADKDLYDALTAGKFCYVLNSRQTGKSSLRVRTMGRLREEGVACAAIDLSFGGTQYVTMEQWYVDMLDTLTESFGLDVDLEEWWEERELLSPLRRFRRFIQEILLVEVLGNIVIFIDEIDSILSLDFPTDDFFAFIRACYQERVNNPEFHRLAFCLLGVATPTNLIQDKKRTPFNIGRAIALTGFKFEEAQPLVKGLEGKVENPARVLEEILAWTGGQPFLTQKVCHLIVSGDPPPVLEKGEVSKNSPLNKGGWGGSETEQEWVAELVQQRIIENWEAQDEPEHLRTIRDRILSNEQRAGRLLGLYQEILQAPNSPLSKQGGSNPEGIPADDSQEQIELRLTGLVIQHNGRLQPYNPIYAQIFNWDWVEEALATLRPYAEAIDAWIASGHQDESRLLRGEALQEAMVWAAEKNLSQQDYHFLTASQELDVQEAKKALEVRRKALEAEQAKKALEAEKQANRLLSEAQQQAELALEEEKQAAQRAKKMNRGGLIGLAIIAMLAVGMGISALRANQNLASARANLEKVNREADKKVREATQKEEEANRNSIQTKQRTEQIIKAAGNRERQANTRVKQFKKELATARVQRDKVIQEAQQKEQSAERLVQQANENVAAAQVKVEKASREVTIAEANLQQAQKNAQAASRRVNAADREVQNAKQEVTLAQRELQEAQQEVVAVQQEFQETQQEIQTIEKLAQLGTELYQTGQQALSEQVLQQAALSFEIADHNLTQAMLLSNTALAYQHLDQLPEANEALTESFKLLQEEADNTDSVDRLPILVSALNTKGSLLEKKDDGEGALAAYEQAFDTLQSLHKESASLKPSVEIVLRNNAEKTFRQLTKFLLQAEGTTPSQQNLQKARRMIESLQLTQFKGSLQIAPVDLVKIDQIDPTAAVIYPIIFEAEERLEIIANLPGQPLLHKKTDIFYSYTPAAQVEVKLRSGFTIPYVNFSNIENNISIFERYLKSPASFQEIKTNSEKIYDFLIEPIEENLKQSNVKTLVFVLDNTLQRIPMAALYDGEQFLVEKYAIALTPSLQLPELKTTSLNNQHKLLVSGIYRGINREQVSYSPLPGVEQEVKTISNLFFSEILLNEEFTTVVLQNLINSSSFSIIHIASHSSSASSFITWNEIIDEDKLSDILEFKNQYDSSPIDLIVFSVNSSAIGNSEKSLFGLAGTALKAGINSSIGALYNVSDNATTELMIEFYKQMYSDQTKAEALRQAQLKMLHSESYEHPYFWSAFVLVGNWK